MEDHATTDRVFEAVKRALAADEPGVRVVRLAQTYFTEYVDGCHNKKEEEHLFPLIESHGISRSGGPLGVMLHEHEESRRLLAVLRPLMTQYIGGDKSVLSALRTMFDQYADLLKNHFWKENDILYPMAKRVMSEADGAKVLAGIEAVEASLGSDTRAKYYDIAKQIEVHGGVEDLALSVKPEVLAAMLNTLPIELSFVDENDVVRYFSHERGEKIFPRSRGVVGSTVQNCHPSKSVHMVNRILADFKAGKRDVAEFWIDLGPKKVHIRYFPVRDESGAYLGCLETVQDIAPIQALTGQRRLLDDA
jgi:DUF438 domain-containing protein